MNYGSIGQYVSVPVRISGGFGALTTSTLLKDNGDVFIWKQGTAHFIGLTALCRTADTGATKPVIGVKNNGGNSVLSTNITVTAADTVYTSGIAIETSNGTYNNVALNDLLEIEVTTAGTNGNALDLIAYFNFILE